MPKFRVSQIHRYIQDYEVEAADELEAMSKVINDDDVVAIGKPYFHDVDEDNGLAQSEEVCNEMYDRYEIYCDDFIPSIFDYQTV